MSRKLKPDPHYRKNLIRRAASLPTRERNTMTEAEQVFVRRMAPHFMAGKSIEDSARAVLDDDARLLGAILEDRISIPISEYAGSHTIDYDRTPAATSLRSAISAHVYQKILATNLP